MTSIQKVIKYIAMALAIFLTIAIISGILNIIYNLVSNVGLIDNPEKTSTITKENYEYKYEDISTYLDIDLKYTNLTIRPGSTLSAEASDKKINIYQEGNRLIVKEKKRNILSKKKANNVYIYIPEDMTFEIVSINTGAGEVYIEDLATNNLNLELGAGKTTLKDIYSLITTIDAGAGSVNINNSNLNNLKLELGVGEVSIDGTIAGRSSIDSGIGEVNLTLTAGAEEYTFDIDKGIGAITLNGMSLADDSIVGTGVNYLKINGGIGAINIKTLD